MRFDFHMCFSPLRRANFSTSKLQNVPWDRQVLAFHMEMCFSPKRRAVFRHRNFDCTRASPANREAATRVLGLGFRVFSDSAGSGFVRKKKYFYRGNEVKRFLLMAAPYGAATCRGFLGRSSRGPFLLFPPTRRP